MRSVYILVLVSFFGLSNLFGNALQYTQDDRDRMIRVENKIDEMGKRFDERFIQFDKRFEQMQAQISQTNQIMLGLLGGIFMMIGFMWRDKRTVVSLVKEEIRAEIKENLASKTDQSKLEKVFEILAELAQKDKNIKEAMEKHHLRLV
jgi:hypothetical protein